MRHPFYKPILNAAVWLLITGILTGCVGQSVTTTPALTDANPAVTKTLSPTNTPTLGLTATPEPPTLYLADDLPADIIQQDALVLLEITDDPEATFWFGPEHKAPGGEVQHTSTWVYALAAPFPTLTDDVSLNHLRLFWRGFQHGAFSAVTKLYIPKTIASTLESQWGTQSPITTQTFTTMPDIDMLWEENAWIIVPFESLKPKLKVISIEGESPLFKDFTLTDYPLVTQYQLIRNSVTGVTNEDEFIQTSTNAIQTTNRDPEKITSLIMTGVTALVRATAFRMEEKGVTYPGEEIRHWLSEADLTHISNEVSFYDNCPFPDPYNRMLLFCSNPKYIELFEYIGADIIELTGNHNNDALYVYGKDVVPFTLDLYEQRGMLYFGGGRDLADAKSPLIMTHNGNQLAFIGCNASGPDFAWATEDQGGAAPCGDYQWMVDEINQLSQMGILPIATFQYYEDYYNFAESHHIKDFGRIAEAGAVIVNGSQAHRPKSMTFHHDAYIDYGLGNLFFDQMGIIDDYGNQILQTRWEKIQRHTFYDGQHLSVELLTAILEDYAQPRPMTPEERQIFLEEIFTASDWVSR